MTTNVEANKLLTQNENGNYLGHIQTLVKQTVVPEIDLRKCFTCKSPVDIDSHLSWELMDFCNESCVLKFQKCLRATCSLCLSRISEELFGKFHLKFDSCFTLFCSKKCQAKYRSTIAICSCCEIVLTVKKAVDWIPMKILVNNENVNISICSQNCFKKFSAMIKMHPIEIPPGFKCSVCKTDKPITNVMKHDGIDNYFCGTRCQTAFNFVKLQMGAGECSMCRDFFNKNILANRVAYDKNAKMSFCSNNCQIVYVLLQKRSVNCNWCQVKGYQFSMIRKFSKSQKDTQFCCVSCLKLHQVSTANLKNCTIELSKVSSNEWHNSTNPLSPLTNITNIPSIEIVGTKRRKIIIQSAKPNEQRNISTMCYVPKSHKSISATTEVQSRSSQTDSPYKILLPVPVPIYTPTPMAMYSVPVPVALPVPIPIPVPVFLPTTRNSVKGILKEIEKVRNAIPNDPLEAELLQIADILAEDKDESDSDSTEVTMEVQSDIKECFNEPIEDNIDLEWAVPDSITQIKTCSEESIENVETEKRVKKRRKKSKENFNEKILEYVENNEIGLLPSVDMRLDYTLGINAWKQWVSKGNLTNKVKFKSEILHMSPEELSYALCLFIKELRKPNGDEYAPDTIYYLCLGIQYYLDISGRLENIFFDQIYLQYIECLDEFAKKFCASLYDNESHFIVTRVEEEHLWETKQLGCYSPYVLLNTLVYFNTKYYLRSNVDEHLELSFYHILKSYRKNAKVTSNPGVIFRFFPRNYTEKRVYEQHENRENPLRCPVKLYEYYLSKCPENVKSTPNYSIYLVPEKHCSCDSPLWYSNQALSKEALGMMINRVKMVKEINVALLSN